MAITTAQIQQLYVAYLGRAADKAGLDYWSAQLNATNATLTLDSLRTNFTTQQSEYTDAYAGLTRAETVSKIYLQLFGRPADAAGAAYWTTGAGATVGADQLLQAFIAGASATDAKVVANKVLVAEVYTATAADGYTKADATSIITGVSDSATSVTTALGHLSDGTLAGIAVPAGVALLKAAATADAAVTSYEQSKAASLVALNDKIVALNATHTAVLGAVTDTDNNGTISYSEAANALTNATLLRTNIGGSTAQLQLNASDKATALSDARANLVSNDANAVTKINAYNTAFANDAKLAVVSQNSIDTATNTLQGAIDASTANTTAFTNAASAYATANPTAAAITDAGDLYAAVKAADAATLAKLDTAFNVSVFTTSYGALKTVAAADAAKAATGTALATAENAIGGHNGDYVQASLASTAATKLVADAQAADALVAQAKAEIAAHDAVTDARDNAHDAVDAITVGVGSDATKTYAVDEAAVANNGTVAGTAKADLFFFGTATGNPTANDFAISSFNKGDAIYVGEGYTFNSNVTVGTDGYVLGSNTAAKEVYFTQAANGTVQVNVETSAVGHTAGTGSVDNVAVITLTGITSLSDVSYANGVITSNHVAA